MDQQNNLEIPQTSIGVVEQSSQEDYIPSSVEKKRALMMYFLFGIIIVISNKKINDFEYFHLKQAMGWRIVFILSILISAVILFIPIIKFIGILLILILMGILFVFVKQTRDGKHYIDFTKYALGIFPSLGVRLLGLFDINLNDPDQTNINNNQVNNQETKIDNTDNNS